MLNIAIRIDGYILLSFESRNWWRSSWRSIVANTKMSYYRALSETVSETYQLVDSLVGLGGSIIMCGVTLASSKESAKRLFIWSSISLMTLFCRVTFARASCKALLATFRLCAFFKLAWLFRGQKLKLLVQNLENLWTLPGMWSHTLSDSRLTCNQRSYRASSKGRKCTKSEIPKLSTFPWRRTNSNRSFLVVHFLIIVFDMTSGARHVKLLVNVLFYVTLPTFSLFQRIFLA